MVLPLIILCIDAFSVSCKITAPLFLGRHALYQYDYDVASISMSSEAFQ
jgi:hypothetical protein